MGDSALGYAWPVWIFKPWGISKLTNTVSKSSRQGYRMDSLMTPLSGPIYLPSTVNSAEDWWTSLRAVSPAKTSALQENGKDSTELEAVFGGKCLESFGKWDPDTSLLRTFQASFWTDRLEPLLGNFPPSGMMRSGTAYRLPPLVRRTSVGGGGVSHIPTPNASDTWVGNLTSTQQKPGSLHSVDLPDYVQMFPTPVQYDATPGGPNNHYKGLGNAAKTGLWPSPNVSDATGSRLSKGKDRPDEGGLLKMARMFPTPKASAEHYGRPRENDRGDLQAAVWGTPYANMDHGAGLPGQLTTQLGTGQLNPTFVEWLMGLPQGWTDLAPPLPPESWQRWQQGGHWADGEWQGVERVVMGVKARVDRLRALGNGIVPAVVAKFLGAL